MNATNARAHAEQLRAKALALYAEAKKLGSGKIWISDVYEELITTLANARVADDVYNQADVIAMRLEAEERRRSRAA